MTVSIFRHVYPRELFARLTATGLSLDEVYPGVYRILGNLCVPTQIIVTSRLPKGKYEAFKVLAKNADKDDVLKLLNLTEAGIYPKIADYVSAVLRVSAAVNKDLYKEIRKEGVMTDAIEEIFEKEFEEERENTKISIAQNMLEGKEPVEKIVRYTNVPLEKIIAIAKKMGISSLAL